MFIIRVTLNILGDRLSPKKLFDLITGEFIISDSNEPTDYKWEEKSKMYEFGAALILHPKKVCIAENFWDYQNWYVDFIEKNHLFFEKCGVQEIRLFWEVFFKLNSQCNFEIYDNNLLSRVTKFNVSIPISVYNITIEQMCDILADANYSQDIINDFSNNN